MGVEVRRELCYFLSLNFSTPWLAAKGNFRDIAQIDIY